MSKTKEADVLAELLGSPPAYTEHVDNNTTSHTGESSAQQTRGLETPRTTATSEQPCVIPQTTIAIKGRSFYPFTRAYAPVLQDHGIPMPEFVSFIDGLNACFVPSQSNVARRVLSRSQSIRQSQRGGFEWDEFNGKENINNTYARIDEYLKATNDDFFHPAGFHVDVQTTGEMMEIIGVSEDKIGVPDLNHISEIDTIVTQQRSGTDIDPRLEHLRSLAQHITPITFDVPASVSSDHLLEKMSRTRVAKSSNRRQREMRREHANILRHEARIESHNERLETQLARLEDRMAANDRNLTIKLAGDDARHHDKIIKRHEQERERLNNRAEVLVARSDKRIEKTANRLERIRSKASNSDQTSEPVQWLVIVPWHQEPAELE